MDNNVQIIPARPQNKITPTGIYVRVSSNSTDQLKSLSAQTSALTSYVAGKDKLLQVDSYVEVVSAKEEGGRPEFQRMIGDCKNGKIKLIITKSLSRFGRDTVEVLDALQQIRDSGASVYFLEENLDSSKVGDDVMISVIGAIAQAENESRSRNILMGLKHRAEDGSLGLYKRTCFGYRKDENGNLAIDEEKAETVRLIYKMYLEGSTPLGIKRELESRGILSPQGKDQWSKSRIEAILANEKYMGEVHVLKSGDGARYVMQDAHPAIITKSVFYAVQDQRAKRSNIEKTPDGIKRKSRKYSSKKKAK